MAGPYVVDVNINLAVDGRIGSMLAMRDLSQRVLLRAAGRSPRARHLHTACATATRAFFRVLRA